MFWCLFESSPEHPHVVASALNRHLIICIRNRCAIKEGTCKYNLHRTYRIPRDLRNGSMRSSIDVNCENTIVFSPSPRSSTSLSNSRSLRILADVGGSPASEDLDLSRALTRTPAQSLQDIESLLLFESVSLRKGYVRTHARVSNVNIHTGFGTSGTASLRQTGRGHP